MSELAPRYNNEALLAHLSTVQANQRKLIYSALEFRETEDKNFFTFLEGEPAGMDDGEIAQPPIVQVLDLQKSSGSTVRISRTYLNKDTPYMAFNISDSYRSVDTHGKEMLIKSAYLDLVLKAWGHSIVSDQMEFQVSNLISEIKLVQQLGVWARYVTQLQMIRTLLGKDVYVKTEDGTNYAMESGQYGRVQLCANYRPNVSALTTDDKPLLQYFEDAAQQLYTGKPYSGVTGHKAVPARCLGRSYRSVVLMHECAFNSLKKNDPKYFAVLKDADVRGEDNRLFRGVDALIGSGGRIFEWDGHLLIILRGEIADQMLFNAGDSITDQNGVLREAAVDGATCILLTGMAAARAVGGSTETFLSTQFGDQRWDGWFSRVTIHKIMTSAPLLFPLTPGDLASAQGADLREMGRALIHVACPHTVTLAG